MKKILESKLIIFSALTIFILLLMSLMKPQNEGDINLICWIPINKEKLDDAESIRKGWGKECGELIFLADFEDRGKNIFDISKKMKLERKETYTDLALKVHHCWEFIYEKYYKEKNAFFLKADTDSYVLVSNLKNFLKKYDQNTPHYIGRAYRQLDEQDRVYVQGGAIIINHPSLSYFVKYASLPENSPQLIYECTREYFKKITNEDLACSIFFFF